jgi:uncharacterized protein (TIRG00374 family)
VILLVFGVMVFDLPPQFEAWKIPAVGVLIAIAALLAFFVYATRNAKPGDATVRRERPASVGGKVKAYLVTFASTAGHLASGPRFVAAMIISLIGWILQLVTFALAAEAAHVSIPIAGSLACLLAINVGLVLRATPGNVGFFQFAYALMAEQFGVGRDDAIAVSLLIQTLQIIPLTLIGVLLAPEFIFRKGRKDPETEAVARELEQERLLHHGPLSTAEEVFERAKRAGVAPAPKKL